jgi:hypothetical protein
VVDAPRPVLERRDHHDDEGGDRCSDGRAADTRRDAGGPHCPRSRAPRTRVRPRRAPKSPCKSHTTSHLNVGIPAPSSVESLHPNRSDRRRRPSHLPSTHLPRSGAERPTTQRRGTVNVPPRSTRGDSRRISRITGNLTTGSEVLRSYRAHRGPHVPTFERGHRGDASRYIRSGAAIPSRPRPTASARADNAASASRCARVAPSSARRIGHCS